jgi:cytochrome c oxidase cbb3-type subunit 3
VSTLWSFFVIAGTLGSLAWVLWLLFSNRTQPKASVETTDHDFDGIAEYDNPLPMWWVGLFVATIVFAIGYLLYYPGLGSFAGLGEWTSHAQWDRDAQAQNDRYEPLYRRLASMSETELHNSTEAQQIGRRLFLNNCASCHGMRARGGYGFPNLTDAEWQWGGDYAAIKATISSGRNAAMPPWGPALGDAGTTDMANYVLSLSGAAGSGAATRVRKRSGPRSSCGSNRSPKGRGTLASGWIAHH